MIYLPQFNNNNCVFIFDSNVIRVYDSNPTVNNPINYTDYYINSHYLSKKGVETLTEPITCEPITRFNDNWKYRNDLSDILISFTIIVCFTIGIPLFLLKTFFKKGRLF